MRKQNGLSQRSPLTTAPLIGNLRHFPRGLVLLLDLLGFVVAILRLETFAQNKQRARVAWIPPQVLSQHFLRFSKLLPVHQFTSKQRSHGRIPRGRFAGIKRIFRCNRSPQIFERIARVMPAVGERGQEQIVVNFEDSRGGI